MPENDEQDVSAGVQAPVETERERFERERLSRRQALKRFGMTSAMATFALFSVDDLARMVGKAMQQRVADNKVVEQVAREFSRAGIAFAASPSGSNPSGTTQTPCSNCCGALQAKNGSAGSSYQICLKSGNLSQEKTCSDVYNKAKCDNWAAYYACIGSQTCPDCSTARCSGLPTPSNPNPSPSQPH